MSLFNRRAVLLGSGAAALSACGFEPVYRQGTSARGLRGAVLVDAPTDRADFNLTRAVEDRLGRPTVPAYGLSVSQSVSETSLAVRGTATITRYNLVGVANYTLRDLKTDAVVSSGQVDSFTSYSATGTTVATSAAERDARHRLAIALGDLIVSELLLELPDAPLAPPVAGPEA